MNGSGGEEGRRGASADREAAQAVDRSQMAVPPVARMMPSLINSAAVSWPSVSSKTSVLPVTMGVNWIAFPEPTSVLAAL